MTGARRPTAVIADDEPALRAHLERLLGEAWPELAIVGSVGDGAAALDAIGRHRPDVAFLDIRMPGPSGLRIARQLDTQAAGMGPRSGARAVPAIVFVTAFEDHAVEAFERAAVDYLLKPVTQERLRATVMRLQRRAAGDRGEGPGLSAQVLDSLVERLAGAASHLQWLRAGQGETVELVAVEEVCFFRADRKYTSAFTRHAEHLVRLSIADLAARLDPERFWRIHRSTIVNVSAVLAAHRDFRGRYRLTLKARPEQLTVSASHASLFRRM